MWISWPHGRLIYKSLLAKTSWASSTSVGIHFPTCWIWKQTARKAGRQLMKESRLILLTSDTTVQPVGGWKTLWGDAVEAGRGSVLMCIAFKSYIFSAKYKCVVVFFFSSPLASLSRTRRVIASFPCLLPWSHLRKTHRRHGKSGCVAKPNAKPAWVLLMFAQLIQRCRYLVRYTHTHTLLAFYHTVSLPARHVCVFFYSLCC